MKKQPARINYFFKDAYVEVWDTIKNLFVQCGKKIADCWDNVADSFEDLKDNIGEIFDEYNEFGEKLGYAFKSFWAAIKLGFFFGQLVLTAILMPLMCILFTAVQIAVVLVVVVVYYLGFLFFTLVDWIYRSIKKISTSCPRCQEKYALPIYVCECGEEHTSLVPNAVYGVLNRTCTCGRKLPTTFLNGRGKLPGEWICPVCEYELDGSMQVDIPIPVIGGPSSGKTCYVNMAISRIEDVVADELDMQFEYIENYELEDDYEENKEEMAQGRLPLKTNDTRLKYYQFSLTPKNESVRNLVSLCDVAGETYEHTDEMGSQIGFKNASGYLMLIDPLSITAFREEVEEDIDISEYGASERPMDEVLDALIHILESMKCLDAKSSIKTNVAVVFTKCDIPGLAEKIGDEAVAEYRQQNNIKNDLDARNLVCEKFLMDYEESNFLMQLKAKFKNIQFFTCSALGHCENGDEFEPVGVEDPVLWLVDKASTSINLQKKWGKKI